jgi:hypothetical protein
MLGDQLETGSAVSRLDHATACVDQDIAKKGAYPGIVLDNQNFFGALSWASKCIRHRGHLREIETRGGSPRDLHNAFNGGLMYRLVPLHPRHG